MLDEAWYVKVVLVPTTELAIMAAQSILPVKGSVRVEAGVAGTIVQSTVDGVPGAITKLSSMVKGIVPATRSVKQTSKVAVS